MKSLFFVVGRGRSGTTLVARMLSRHPKLLVAPEGFFAIDMHRDYATVPRTAERIDHFCRDLVRENRMKTWGLDLSDVANRLRTAGPDADYAWACGQVYESYAHTTSGKASAQHFGDKNPHYALRVAELAELFPTAKFIHVVRDPRDNVLSYRGVPFDLRDPRALAFRWRAYNERIVRAAQAAPDRFTRLRYEDLLAEPEAELSRLVQFLGLDFEPGMLDFASASDSRFYGKDSAWFRGLKGPLDPAQTQKWRAGLDARSVAAVELICRPLMARFGYPLTEPVSARELPATAAFAALGALSVVAEDVVFTAIPAPVRIACINRYRKQTGRI